LATDDVTDVGDDLATDDVTDVGDDLATDDVTDVGDDLATDDVTDVGDDLATDDVTDVGDDLATDDVTDVGDDLATDDVTDVGDDLATDDVTDNTTDNSSAANSDNTTDNSSAANSDNTTDNSSAANSDNTTDNSSAANPDNTADNSSAANLSPANLEPPVRIEFPQENQPLVGAIDSGFSPNNPDIDYSRITWGQDYVDQDADPTLQPGEGNEHGTHVLGIIAATQDNDIGIDGINNQAPVWASRAIGSGKWAEALEEFVDTAKESAQPNAVVNLSLDLTQSDAEGNVTTRYELTPKEREALEYARQNNVLVVVAAGNDGGVMSALGQASQEFDNIITVGSAEQSMRLMLLPLWLKGSHAHLILVMAKA
jgi:hypothetical protein